MINLIVLAVLFIATLTFTYFNEKKNQDMEIDRFREVIKGFKSENLSDYVDTIPIKDDMPEFEEADELIELEDVEPKELIRAIKKQE